MSRAQPPAPAGFRCHVPPCFAPTRSPLARLVASRVADRRQAEAAYYGALVVLAAMTLLALQWTGMALIERGGLAHTVTVLGPALALFAAFAVGGRQRGIAVSLSGDELVIARGATRLAVPCNRIADVREVPDAEVHRHWSRYEQTILFVNRRPEHHLLLRLADGRVVVLGLDPRDRARLAEALEASVAVPVGT